MLYLEDEAAFPTILDRLNTDIFNQFEPTNVYDYIPLEGTAILDVSKLFEAQRIQEVLPEPTEVIPLNASPLEFNQYETIIVFLGNTIPSILNPYRSEITALDNAMTVFENERGQTFIIGRSTSQFSADYFDAFIDAMANDERLPKRLSLSLPEGITLPQTRPVTADICYTEEYKYRDWPGGRQASTTVSHEIPIQRVRPKGSPQVLSILIDFEGIDTVISDEAYFSMVEKANETSDDFFLVMSEGQLDLDWVYFPEVLTMPYFLTPELQPSTPEYQIEINKHVTAVLQEVEKTMDLSDVELINFFWPVGLPDYVYGGLSDLLSERMDTQTGNIYNYSVKKIEQRYIAEPETLARNIYHGIAHNLGLTDIYLHPFGPEFEGKSTVYKYGNWDIMTSAFNELNAWHRWILTWMPDEQVHCLPVSEGGSHEVFIEPLNEAEADTRQIVISVSESEALSIELRGPGPYCPEERWESPYPWDQGGCTQNILVTHIDTSIGNDNGPKQILRPTRSTEEDYSDALLLEGEFVTYENITITHSERYALGSIITIDFGE